MKKLIQSGLTIVAITLSFTGNSCAQCKHIGETRMVLFFDITDPEHRVALKKNIEEEFGQIQVYLNKGQAFSECNKVTVKVSPINDKGANRIQVSTSDQISSDMTSTQIRRTVKAKFYRDLQRDIINTISMIRDDSTELQQTRIYEPLCLLLKENRNTHEILDVIIYSDLQENGQISFYKKGKPIPVEKTMKALEASCNCILPQDLSFLRIHFISFRTNDNDRLIGPAREFWETVFSKRKATIRSGTGLQSDFFLSPQR